MVRSQHVELVTETCVYRSPPDVKKRAAATSAKKSYARSVREEAQRRFAKFGRI